MQYRKNLKACESQIRPQTIVPKSSIFRALADVTPKPPQWSDRASTAFDLVQAVVMA
jgi:hypothetical protein